MSEELDPVARYGRELGFEVRPRTVLVEGTTDVELFQKAARLEKDATRIDLLENDLTIIAAGNHEQGGVNGGIRELICFRGLARTCLLANGRPRYRFIGLFDNDHAGRMAVNTIRDFDTSILEFKDVFRLRPIMPMPGNLDPGTMHKTFERENDCYKGLDWELEDFLPSDFYDAFLTDHPSSVVCTKQIGNKIHRELTRDGKAQLHRFVKLYAIQKDLIGVIDLLKTIRFYLLLK